MTGADYPHRSTVKNPVTWIAVAALLVMVVTVFLADRPRPQVVFDPLRLPIQTVEDRVPGVEGPAVKLGADLHVTATKCNTSGRDIEVQGQASWQSVDPAGTTITVGGGSSTRPGEPRCRAFSFSNPMPPAVEARIRELVAEGKTRQVWKLTGVETPLAPNAIARSWTTQDFVVVP